MKVVAISGVSGSGKTTVIKQLAQMLNSPYLLFDDYTTADTYPKDMKAWFANGADLSEIKTPELLTSLTQLKKTCKEDFILIEEPFGKQRSVIADHIDYVVLLDPPMEICLARVITRHLNYSRGNALNSIPKYLSMYNDYFREIYITLNNQTREQSDLIVTDIASVEVVTNLISNWLLTYAH